MTPTRCHLTPARLRRAATLFGLAPAPRQLATTVEPITGPATSTPDEHLDAHLAAVGERAKVPARRAVA